MDKLKMQPIPADKNIHKLPRERHLLKINLSHYQPIFSLDIYYYLAPEKVEKLPMGRQKTVSRKMTHLSHKYFYEK